MSTITTTSNTTNGNITLVIEKTATITKVLRTNVNGIEEVRVPTGVLPSALASTFRTNLIYNPRPANGTSWTITGFTTDNTVSYPTTGSPTGNGHYRMTRNISSVDSWSVTQTSNVIPVASGDKVNISWYLRGVSSSAFTSKVELNINRYSDSGGTTLISSTMPYTSENQTSGWSRFSYAYTVPAGTLSIKVGLTGYHASVNGGTIPIGATLDTANVLVEKVAATGTYFDGGSSGGTWTGTANNSTSTVGSGGTVIITDYEASYGLNTYNAYHADGTSATATETLDITKPWLSVPVMPQYSEQVEEITGFNAVREAATTVHRPLGRADALVVMGKLGTRMGTMEIFCSSYADARKFERVFERGEIVQLRQRVANMDMYFTVTSIPVAPYAVNGETNTKWAMTVQYVEVRRPIGNLAGALGWTFDAMTAQFASFDAATAFFPTFDSMTLGEGVV
jgi:hypothetical protein